MEVQEMKRITIWMLIGLMALSVALTSCSGGIKVDTQKRTTTLGQELMDLEKAYKSGVITEKEYQKAKEKLLKDIR
jgi:hypothetical protein